MYDPDAPTALAGGAGLPSISRLPYLNCLKAPVEYGQDARGINDDQHRRAPSAYFGACPPKGEARRYVITVKALSVAKMDLPKNASGALAGFMTHANELGEATITFKAGH